MRLGLLGRSREGGGGCESRARSKFPKTFTFDGARHMGSWVCGRRGEGGERERQQVTSSSRYTPPYNGRYRGDVMKSRGRSIVRAEEASPCPRTPPPSLLAPAAAEATPKVNKEFVDFWQQNWDASLGV